MSFVAVICGLKSEATAVRAAMASSGIDASQIRIGISGANAAHAEELARDYASKGAKALLSIGISGGLDPILVPGDLVISSAVSMMQNGATRFIPTPQKTFLDGVSFSENVSAPRRKILGVDEIVDSSEQKSAFFLDAKAAAVDMESHKVAYAAFKTGLPFLAIRAIADPADRALPKAALNAVAPDGSTRVMRTLFEALKAPAQFPALLQLGCDSEKALATLRRELGSILKQVIASLDI